MKVIEYRNESGELVYFEVSSLWTRSLAFKAIRTIPGVEIVKPLRHFTQENQDVFCVFKLQNTILEIEEPWGDSSRFEVRANPPLPNSDLEVVKKHFSSWPFSRTNA